MCEVDYKQRKKNNEDSVVSETNLHRKENRSENSNIIKYVY